MIYVRNLVIAAVVVQLSHFYVAVISLWITSTILIGLSFPSMLPYESYRERRTVVVRELSIICMTFFQLWFFLVDDVAE